MNDPENIKKAQLSFLFYVGLWIAAASPWMGNEYLENAGTFLVWALGLFTIVVSFGLLLLIKEGSQVSGEPRSPIRFTISRIGLIGLVLILAAQEKYWLASIYFVYGILAEGAYAKLTKIEKGAVKDN